MARRRRHKISKLQLAWKILVVVSLLLNYLQLQSKAVEWFSSRPVVQRVGIKYIIKGWLSNWDLHWLVK